MTPLTQLSDAELLARYNGEATREENGEDAQAAERQEAFRLLVLRHGRIVMSACRGVLRNESDAEDAFQATFFVLARKAGTVERGASLAAWLHRVAMRISIRAAKRKQQHKTTSLETVAEPSSGELQLVSTQASLRAVHEATARLDESLRSTVLLTYFAGLNRKETAQRLGITPGVVQARLKKARGQLRRRLALRGTSLAAFTVLAWQSSTSLASASLARLCDACANTVFHVQAGLAASSAGTAIPQTLAQGVIRSMTINTTLRHVMVVAVTVAGAWLAFGSSQSRGGGANAEVILPVVIAEQTAADAVTFVSVPVSQDGQDVRQSNSQQTGQGDSSRQIGDEQDEEDVKPGETAWGKGTRGLQAGVRFKDESKAGPFNFGDKAEIEFVIRNVGEETIEFESAEWREDDQYFVKNLADEKATIETGKIWYSGLPRIKRYTLKPGEEVAIDTGPMGIGGNGIDAFEHPVVYVPKLTEGNFSAWFQLRMPDIVQAGKDQGWTGTLTTGNLKLEVKKPVDSQNTIK